MKAAIEFIDMNREELNPLLERARASLAEERRYVAVNLPRLPRQVA